MLCVCHCVVYCCVLLCVLGCFVIVRCFVLSICVLWVLFLCCVCVVVCLGDINICLDDCRLACCLFAGDVLHVVCVFVIVM